MPLLCRKKRFFKVVYGSLLFCFYLFMEKGMVFLCVNKLEHPISKML